MRKIVLLLCSVLVLGTLSAQKNERFTPNKKHRTEIRRDAKINASKEARAVSDSIRKVKNKALEVKVSNRISLHKMELLADNTEMIDTFLLDEVVSTNNYKRTFTYSKEGRRDAMNEYRWENGSWAWGSKTKYEYQYDDFGRYTRRSTYLSFSSNGSDEREVSRVEISYNAGSTYYKYYDMIWTGEQENLLLSYENGYDAQGREVLYKSYQWNGTNTYLNYWQEYQYSANGEEVLRINWYGDEENQYGSRDETIVSGLTTETSTYSWDSNAWLLERSEIITTDEKGNTLKKVYISKDNSEENYSYRSETTYEYNASGRITSEIFYQFDSDDYIEYGWNDKYTYDAYDRITSNLFMDYEGGTFVNSEKSEFTYWGTENTRDENEKEEFEGPLLTYSNYEWLGNTWELEEQLVYTRNASGIITGGTNMEKDEIEIGGADIDVIRTSLSAFDSKGLITGSETKYVNEAGSTLKEEKDTYSYDSKDRQTNYKSWEKINNNWVLNEEENYAYDTQDRKTLDEYRYKNDSSDESWYGSKTVTAYKGNLTETTNYSVNPATGIFKTTPNNFYSDGTLSDGTTQIIHISYDESGNPEYGRKEESLINGTKETHAYWELEVATQEWVGRNKTSTDFARVTINMPGDPENYEDGIGQSPDNAGREMLMEVYRWENGNWILEHKRGYEKQPNGDILFYNQDGNTVETQTYSFDSKGRVVRIAGNDGRTTVYTYNSDGLLETFSEDGILTTYYYSIHKYMPTDIEEVTTAEASLTVDGRTVTADNADTLLRVYSVSGHLIATGTGSLSIPESGIYIVTTPVTTQKISVQ